ncbi:lytic transglycosylase domain-containing protein [Sphaerisporangium rhizosphaerae]|uniref:Lytic murein transglycosylase n=1 Tax=Sphaerisporangium rhizosphaerae TaxID=2269375 RepID=A0ABW2NWT9_9ACTN
MSPPPRPLTARAVMAGLALLIVLGVAAGGAFLVSRGTAGAVPAAARTQLAGVGDLSTQVSPFPVLTPGPIVAGSPLPSSAATVPDGGTGLRTTADPSTTANPTATPDLRTPAAPRTTVDPRTSPGPNMTAGPKSDTGPKTTTPTRDPDANARPDATAGPDANTGPDATARPTTTPYPEATASGSAAYQRVAATPPRLIAVARAPVTEAALRRIAALKYVGKVTPADAGAVRFSTATLNLLAVDPAEFRPWAPKAVAEEPEVWSALARGEFIAESRTADRYLLQLGGEYEAGAGSRLRVAASAPFGLPGVDGLVGKEVGRALGLVPGVAVLVHTPAGKAAAVGVRVRRLLGAGAQVVVVGARSAAGTPVPVAPPSAAPSAAPSTAPLTAQAQPGTYRVGRPAGYLDLYKLSAQGCPGLSWTVLAAIGQVESGHGRNNGPSSAGALGPMQFMPATWKAYGVDGDGDGRSDIWSPYDAVPGAARYLCANGAGQGGAKLRSAVFRYNHSWDYVNKVLGIADAYARAYA